MAPISDDPNTPDPQGWNPIQRAVLMGYSRVVEILAPLCDYPNAPDPMGKTPIQRAANHGNTRIIEILAPLCNNPNAFSDNPNSPCPITDTNK